MTNRNVQFTINDSEHARKKLLNYINPEAPQPQPEVYQVYASFSGSNNKNWNRAPSKVIYRSTTDQRYRGSKQSSTLVVAGTSHSPSYNRAQVQEPKTEGKRSLFRKKKTQLPPPDADSSNLKSPTGKKSK